MVSLKNKIVCITGASAGIGEACAREFARQGASLLLSARRKERVDALARQLAATHQIRTHTFKLDVTLQKDVERAFDTLPKEWKNIDILVNNAGLSRGLDKLHEGKIQDWDEMVDTNIKGLLYVSRAVLPGMVRRQQGQVINLGSIAGHQVYPGGNVYCASKAAVNLLGLGMKMDLLGTGVRVCSVEPGLVESEFSEVRFRGDKERAAKVYADTRPLKPEDVADVVVFCANRPPHVDISSVIIMPTDQASVYHVHRTPRS
jgi:3-hydroxy acid dehydrogenase / malonic semialdehyde reductase